jgi:hypothetical protein
MELIVESFSLPLSLLKRFEKNFGDAVSRRTPFQSNKLTFHDENLDYDSHLVADQKIVSSLILTPTT